MCFENKYMVMTKTTGWYFHIIKIIGLITENPKVGGLMGIRTKARAHKVQAHALAPAKKSCWI